MIDLIEAIGPVLGVVAFLGLAILAFLIFQQAREVRRLREWAGRAPERAGEAAEAVAAVAEARGEEAPEPEEADKEVLEAEPSRLALWWRGLRTRAEPAFQELDRRLPVEPRYLFAVGAAAIVAAAVLTSGFGFFGDDDGRERGGGGGERRQQQDELDVAVLNATQVEEPGVTPVAGVPQLASKVADEVIRELDGYDVATETDAASGLDETVVMYEDGSEDDAEELAQAISEQLGPTETTPIIEEVRERGEGAPLALVIGLDDEGF
jgi:hypothetical protein